MDLKIGIEGLSEFSRALGKLDKDLPKLIRTANNTAADLLISKTRPLIPAVKGNARASLTARSTRTSARIQVGGKKAPYYPWLDFGGEGKIKGHPAHRTFIKEGRYLYPTLRKNRDEIMKMQHASMVDIARTAGLDVE